MLYQNISCGIRRVLIPIILLGINVQYILIASSLLRDLEGYC